MKPKTETASILATFCHGLVNILRIFFPKSSVLKDPHVNLQNTPHRKKNKMQQEAQFKLSQLNYFVSLLQFSL